MISLNIQNCNILLEIIYENGCEPDVFRLLYYLYFWKWYNYS